MQVFATCSLALMAMLLRNSNKSLPDCNAPDIQGTLKLRVHPTLMLDKVLLSAFFCCILKHSTDRCMYQTQAQIVAHVLYHLKKALSGQ